MLPLRVMCQPFERMPSTIFIDLKPQIQNYSFSLYIEVISFGSSRFDTGIGAIRGKDTDRIPADKRQQH